MAGKKSELGATGTTAAQNVKRLREQHGLSYAELSRTLEEIGRPIPPLGLRRIETGDRRIDTDDLVALAIALRSSPVTFLSPNSDDPDSGVPVTGMASPVEAKSLWEWLVAERPPWDRGGRMAADDRIDWWKNALPYWRRAQLSEGLVRLAEIKRVETESSQGDPSELQALIERYSNGDDSKL